MKYVITVEGIDAAPQGSKSYIGKNKLGRGMMIESCKRVKPFRNAVTSPVLLISKNSSFVDSLFSSNMKRLNIRSSGPAKLVLSGSGSPGVGHGNASPRLFIVLQSVVILHSTKST